MSVHRGNCDHSHKECNHEYKNRHHGHLNCDSHKNTHKTACYHDCGNIKGCDSRRPPVKFIPNLKTIHHETKCLHAITADIKCLKVNKLKSKSPLPISLSRPSQIAVVYPSNQPTQNEEGEWVARVRVRTDFIDKTADSLVTAIHEPIVRALGQGKQEIKGRIIGIYEETDGSEVRETLSLHHQEVEGGTLYTPNHKTQRTHIQRNWTGFIFEIKSADGPFELVQEENPQDALLTFSQQLVQPGEEASTNFPICVDIRGHVVSSDSEVGTNLQALDCDYALALSTGTLYIYDSSSTPNPWTPTSFDDKTIYLGWNAGLIGNIQLSIPGSGSGYQIFELNNNMAPINLIDQNQISVGDTITDTNANNAVYTMRSNRFFVLAQSFVFDIGVCATNNFVYSDTSTPPPSNSQVFFAIVDDPSSTSLPQLYFANPNALGTWMIYDSSDPALIDCNLPIKNGDFYAGNEERVSTEGLAFYISTGNESVNTWEFLHTYYMLSFGAWVQKDNINYLFIRPDPSSDIGAWVS